MIHFIKGNSIDSHTHTHTHKWDLYTCSNVCQCACLSWVGFFSLGISYVILKVYPHVSCVTLHLVSLSVLRPSSVYTCVSIVRCLCISACVFPSLFSGLSVVVLCLLHFQHLLPGPCLLVAFWFDFSSVFCISLQFLGCAVCVTSHLVLLVEMVLKVENIKTSETPSPP